MHNEFTAVFERDGDWFMAFCPEIPGANGQGRTKEEARESLRSFNNELVSLEKLLASDPQANPFSDTERACALCKGEPQKKDACPG